MDAPRRGPSHRCAQVVGAGRPPNLPARVSPDKLHGERVPDHRPLVPEAPTRRRPIPRLENRKVLNRRVLDRRVLDPRVVTLDPVS